MAKLNDLLAEQKIHKTVLEELSKIKISQLVTRNLGPRTFREQTRPTGSSVKRNGYMQCSQFANEKYYVLR